MGSAIEAQITVKQGASCIGGIPAGQDRRDRQLELCMPGTASVFDRMLMSGQV